MDSSSLHRNIIVDEYIQRLHEYSDVLQVYVQRSLGDDATEDPDGVYIYPVGLIVRDIVRRDMRRARLGPPRGNQGEGGSGMNEEANRLNRPARLTSTRLPQQQSRSWTREESAEEVD